ncbi:unnamed protein product [Schistosoma mattheei]|uniref:Uncharacterized protein n=1 Tax=Schistosoma mattheei TaxID=31246 RepID=A0A183P133_9TREM|nr:unnamed protein product [Schistosoma mattheei]
MCGIFCSVVDVFSLLKSSGNVFNNFRRSSLFSALRNSTVQSFRCSVNCSKTSVDINLAYIMRHLTNCSLS